MPNEIVRYTPSEMVTEVAHLAENYNDCLNVIEQDNSIFDDIGEAIVSKDGGATPEKDEMPTRIANIPTGGGTLISKTITENGVYNASSDNADGYDVVTVAIPTTQGVLYGNTSN